MNDYLSKKIKILSFFAILLVFLQHAINFTGYIDPGSLFYGKASLNSLIQYIVGYGLARPAVAMFFFLSGFLFFRNFTLAKTVQKLLSRVRSLLIPYVLWNALAIGFVIVLQTTPYIQTLLSSFYTGYLPGRSLNEYLMIIVNHGVAFPLWFMFDLLIFTLLAPFLYLFVRFGKIIGIVVVWYMWFFQVPMPPLVSFVHRGLFFYLFGSYLAIHQQNILLKAHKHVGTIVLYVWICMLFVKTYIAFYGISFSSYLPFIDSISILIGSVTIWYMYDQLSTSRTSIWIEQFVPFTFFIYASHEPLLEVLKSGSIRLLSYTDITLFLTYIIVPIATIIICLRLAKLLKRYTPFFYMLLSGGR